MTDRERRDALSDGVYGWMADHPISTYDALSDGAAKGVKEWLDAHREEIVEALKREL